MRTDALAERSHRHFRTQLEESHSDDQKKRTD